MMLWFDDGMTAFTGPSGTKRTRNLPSFVSNIRIYPENNLR
jgi:hypothetical protein